MGRRRLTVALTALAVLLGTASAEAKQLTRYDVGGGIAGRHDRLIVATNGEATQTGDSGDHRFTVSAKNLRGLERELKAAKFKSLKRQYKPKFQVFDGITQTIRYRGKAVSIYSGADNIPTRLQKVMRRISRIMRS
jgi:hypothetical protein